MILNRKTARWLFTPAFLLFFLFFIQISQLFATSTSVAYSDDPSTAHFGTWGANVVIDYTGSIGDSFSISRSDGTTTGSAVTLGRPAQMGGFNWIFNSGSNGQVYTVNPGGASCVLVIQGTFRYCGVTPPLPIDTDGDGIPDINDSCPNDGDYGFGVNPDGCPDEDLDTILDNVDACPTRGDENGTGVDPTGCPNPPLPRDGDGDGIDNPDDTCPAKFGPAPHGCPDADGDGLHDGIDACPAQGDAGLGLTADGCPIAAPDDTDNDDDGVLNVNDRCPYVGNQGYGLTADGCPIPAPAATATAIPGSTVVPVATLPYIIPRATISETECQVGNLGTEAIRIRSTAGMDGEIVARLQPGTIADAVLDTTSQPGWVRIQDGGVEGWVSASVVYQSGPCDGLTNITTPTPVPTAAPEATAEPVVETDACPELEGEFAALPDYLKAYVTSANGVRTEAGCRWIENWRSNPVTIGVRDLDPAQVDVIAAECQDALPGFLLFVDTMVDTYSGDDAALVTALNDQLAGSPCDFAQGVVAGTFPADLPPELVVDAVLSFCKPNGLPESRVLLIKAQFERLQLSTDDLLNLQDCELIQMVNLLGNLSPDQVGIFSQAKTCEYDDKNALNLVLTALMAQTTEVDVSAMACENLVSLVSQGAELVDALPAELSMCPEDLVTLFWTNHKQTLDLMPGQTSPDEYYQRLLATGDPCQAVQVYVMTGRIPRSALAADQSADSTLASLDESETYLPSAPNLRAPVVRVTRGVVLNETPEITLPEDLSGDSPVMLTMFTPAVLGDLRLVHTIFQGISGQELAELFGFEQSGSLETRGINSLDVNGNLSDAVIDNSNDSPLLLYTLEDGGVTSFYVRVLGPEGLEARVNLGAYTIMPGTRFDVIPREGAVLMTLQGQNTSGIYRVSNLTSSPVVELVVANGSNPSTHNDGKLMVFERSENGQRAVYAFNLTNGREDRVSEEGLDCFSPVFDSTERLSMDVFFLCNNGEQTLLYWIGQNRHDPIPLGEGLTLNNLDYGKGVFTMDNGEQIYSLFNTSGTVDLNLRLMDMGSAELADILSRFRWSIGAR